MKFKLPADVEWIVRFLEENGYETYLVGGAVRDLVRNIPPKDYDFATSATPEEILEVFKEYRSFTQGARFGTIGVVLHNHHYEITTFRKDRNYIDARRPESVIFTNDIKEDLMRRDFTINALAYHPDKGLLDFFGGQSDLQNKVIRAVGDAKVRFTEDALRILRAIRFSITLDFHIAPSTKQAMLELLNTIQIVATERVHDEILKCFYHFETLEETLIDVLEMYFPMLKSFTKEKWSELLDLFKVLPPKESYYYTFLFDDIPFDTVFPFLKNFKVSTATIYEVKTFAKYLNITLEKEPFSIKSHLRELKKELFLSVLFVKRMQLWSKRASMQDLEDIIELTESILEHKEPYLLRHLKIDGNTLQLHGVPEGKKMKAVLEHLLLMVMQDPTRNEEEILLTLSKTYLANHS